MAREAAFEGIDRNQWPWQTSRRQTAAFVEGFLVTFMSLSIASSLGIPDNHSMSSTSPILHDPPSQPTPPPASPKNALPFTDTSAHVPGQVMHPIDSGQFRSQFLGLASTNQSKAEYRYVIRLPPRVLPPSLPLRLFSIVFPNSFFSWSAPLNPRPGYVPF